MKLDELLKLIEKHRIIAIDGPAGSGKSTLARKIKSNLPSVEIVQLDNFYLTKDKRDDDLGHFNVWNYDYDRLINQVIIPWKNKTKSNYEAYDYFKDKITGTKSIFPSDILLIEGITSLHPDLRSYIDFSIWISADEKLRLERGIARDGERFRSQWIEEWMPSESKYIEEYHPEKYADIKLKGSIK